MIWCKIWKRRIDSFPDVIVKTVFVCGMEKRGKSYRRSLKGRMINMLVVIEFLNPKTSRGRLRRHQATRHPRVP